MVRKSPAAWAAACCLLASLAAPAAGPTLQQILAKNYEARGGLDKLRSIRSARMTGKMVLPGGLEAPLVWEWKAPNKMRMEFTMQGMTGVMASNGSSGWRIMPFMGKTDPEPMTDEEFQQIEPQADFTGMLVDPEKKGYEIEYVGQAEAEGTPAYKLKVTRKKTGDVTYVYLDSEVYLEIRQESKRKIRGQEVEAESTIGDYKMVGGIAIPHSISSKAKGAPAGQTLVIEKVELNVDIPDERFEMPQAAPAAKP